MKTAHILYVTVCGFNLMYLVYGDDGVIPPGPNTVICVSSIEQARNIAIQNDAVPYNFE